jgi:ankyrin repeat protein
MHHILNVLHLRYCCDVVYVSYFFTGLLPYFAGIEVNFMDDVGQTLLNWASAFGTQEMVEFLCDRGADVNKGKPAILTHLHLWI